MLRSTEVSVSVSAPKLIIIMQFLRGFVFGAKDTQKNPSRDCHGWIRVLSLFLTDFVIISVLMPSSMDVMDDLL